jgi:hypothetical protein
MAELKSGRATAHERSAQPFGDSAPKFPSSKPAGLATLARSIYQNDFRLQLVLLAFMVVFYGALLWGAWGKSERTVAWNYTFNSMLAHLMQGRFDVDPQIVGWEEGFLRNGLTYSYFGIWPAASALDPSPNGHRPDLAVLRGRSLRCGLRQSANGFAGAAKKPAESDRSMGGRPHVALSPARRMRDQPAERVHL